MNKTHILSAVCILFATGCANTERFDPKQAAMESAETFPVDVQVAYFECLTKGQFIPGGCQQQLWDKYGPPTLPKGYSYPPLTGAGGMSHISERSRTKEYVSLWIEAMEDLGATHVLSEAGYACANPFASTMMFSDGISVTCDGGWGNEYIVNFTDDRWKVEAS